MWGMVNVACHTDDVLRRTARRRVWSWCVNGDIRFLAVRRLGGSTAFCDHALSVYPDLSVQLQEPLRRCLPRDVLNDLDDGAERDRIRRPSCLFPSVHQRCKERDARYYITSDENSSSESGRPASVDADAPSPCAPLHGPGELSRQHVLFTAKGERVRGR